MHSRVARSVMRILITNDDGIHAPGLEACETIARALSDEVWIVAPESDQSGVAHSLSLATVVSSARCNERAIDYRSLHTRRS